MILNSRCLLSVTDDSVFELVSAPWGVGTSSANSDRIRFRRYKFQMSFPSRLLFQYRSSSAMAWHPDYMFDCIIWYLRLLLWLLLLRRRRNSTKLNAQIHLGKMWNRFIRSGIFAPIDAMWRSVIAGSPSHCSHLCWWWWWSWWSRVNTRREYSSNAVYISWAPTKIFKTW